MLFWGAIILSVAVAVFHAYLLLYGFLLTQPAIKFRAFYVFHVQRYGFGIHFVYVTGAVFFGVQCEAGPRSVRIRALLLPPPPGR